MGVEGLRQRVKVYATDVDQEALNLARQGSYGEKGMEGVDTELRKKYFETANGRFVFRTDFRRSVIFGRHDLVQDAPISHLDLLICRNTLMYFNAETQGRILSRLHFALKENGYLFLGKAELLLTHANLFTPADLKFRIFGKVPQVHMRERLPAAAQLGNAEAGNQIYRRDRLLELAIEEAPVARILVDINGNLALANQKARLLFTLNPKDIGRPLQDLEISYRPAELRPVIEQAHAERRSVVLTSVERRFPSGESQYLDILVSPFYDDGNNPVGAGISFLDVTRYYKLQEELQHSKEELQTFTEELQSSNEELETTNEELQSTNEELETTNEELQSTNEELETMNEELQSTNEEIQTVNDEMRQRTDELNHTNAFLNSVLSSLRSGVLVVNRDAAILNWNRGSEELWGLRADEVKGKSLLNLDIGVPVGQLRSPIRACVAGEEEQQDLVLDAVNRRGKPIKCHITITPFKGPTGERLGAVLIMEEMGM
jgi:two-component system CheB/CheR fusion protein